MEKETRNFILTIGVVVVVIAGAYAALVAYTGFTMPFSSVVSESMQHDDTRSELGVIDTGDIVVVMDPSKAEIQSYVEGIASGYQTFGNYGSVIIYNRGDAQNPVIHRAILWLDYNGDGTWSASSLANIMGDWYCTYSDGTGSHVNNEDWSSLRGVLTLNIDGKTPSINLDTLTQTSGYLTMGDNPVTNPNFDQSSGIVSHLISYDDIRSVPILEIPWVGSLKLLISGSSSLEHVPNSVPSLIMAILIVFSLLLLIDLFAIRKYGRNMTETVRSIRSWKKA